MTSPSPTAGAAATGDTSGRSVGSCMRQCHHQYVEAIAVNSFLEPGDEDDSMILQECKSLPGSHAIDIPVTGSTISTPWNGCHEMAQESLNAMEMRMSLSRSRSRSQSAFSATGSSSRTRGTSLATPEGSSSNSIHVQHRQLQHTDARQYGGISWGRQMHYQQPQHYGSGGGAGGGGSSAQMWATEGRNGSGHSSASGILTPRLHDGSVPPPPGRSGRRHSYTAYAPTDEAAGNGRGASQYSSHQLQNSSTSTRFQYVDGYGFQHQHAVVPEVFESPPGNARVASSAGGSGNVLSDGFIARRGERRGTDGDVVRPLSYHWYDEGGAGDGSKARGVYHDSETPAMVGSPPPAPAPYSVTSRSGLQRQQLEQRSSQRYPQPCDGSGVVPAVADRTPGYFRAGDDVIRVNGTVDEGHDDPTKDDSDEEDDQDDRDDQDDNGDHGELFALEWD